MVETEIEGSAQVVIITKKTYQTCQGPCNEWSSWTSFFPECMTTPGETILDSEQYRPKRIRLCLDDNEITETEFKSDKEPGLS